MSTIPSLQSNGYYSLNNQSANSSAATSGATSALSTLAPISSTSTKADSAYSLNLSEDALAYIQKINGTKASKTDSYSSISSFVLTKSQQETLNGILEKYKNAPFTQETFEQIQDDLTEAGLSPESLSKQDSIRNFNPTKFLLDALSGTSTGEEDNTSLFSDKTKSSDNSEDATTKSTNFITSVADQWARISTTAKDAKANND